MAKRSLTRPADGWIINRATTHPGEMLREEFVAPYKLSAAAVARATGIPVRQLRKLLHEQCDMSAEMALRVGRYFGMSPEFWMNCQKMYELSKACMERGRQIDREVRPFRRDEAAA